MTEKRQLMWFRTDLRITDNPALYHASQAGSVIGVFLLFPGQWQEHNDGENKLWFQMQNLQALKQSLKDLNIPLIVIQLNHFNEAPDTLLLLVRKLQCSAVWFNREYGVNERHRDKCLRDLLLTKNIECHTSIDQTLFVPGSILNRQREYFKVFTPFKNYLYKQLSIDQLTPLPPPKKQRLLSIPNYPEVKYQNLYTPTADLISPKLIASEQHAHQLLMAFIEDHSSDYKATRDIPSVDGTSYLSSFLVAGTLSVRQCFYAALMANNNELDTGNQGLTCWMGELIWREFYKHILYGFPRVSKHQAFKPITEQLPWSHDQKQFNAWKNGETGYPLIDAAMKQLVHTGWMHNRLRMATAMFLSKNLMLDWRLGEAFFMEHLIDGDLSANNGGWQWSASTGTDAVPYFRMFNPVSQSQRFDPEGTFIRQWLPQLKELDNKSIHEPWTSKKAVENYPTPLVDHAASRARVMTSFKQLKNS
ncbi:hypothetical protein ACH42_13585 [Endozoicomonas sp. (ex Bugula neritina AB1)]|nr:hypothetical protein ACH42_13585 [Endozoicomonas sp. (ex Bugula neritina AB1)]